VEESSLQHLLTHSDELTICHLLAAVVDELVDEVIISTNLQPSVPGVVCQLITDIIKSETDLIHSSGNSNGADIRKPKKSHSSHKKLMDTVRKRKVVEETQEAVMDVLDDEVRLTPSRSNSKPMSPSSSSSASTVVAVTNGSTDSCRHMAPAHRSVYQFSTSGSPAGTTSTRPASVGSGYCSHIVSPAPSGQSTAIGSVTSSNRQDNKIHYRTLMKTRKYVNVDGEVVTSQTSTVVVTGEENKRQLDHEIWKADLRELKLLQKIENKQYQDLMLRAQYLKDQQTRKVEQEMQMLLKNYEVDIEDLNRKQKALIEKTELTQNADCRVFHKKLRLEQVGLFTVLQHCTGC
jgi:STE20-like kinase